MLNFSRLLRPFKVHVPSTSEMIVSSLTNLLELDIDYVGTPSIILLSHVSLPVCVDIVIVLELKVCTEAAVVMKDLVRKCAFVSQSFHKPFSW